jgi:GNAT superfamily N-acetyltransferase
MSGPCSSSSAVASLSATDALAIRVAVPADALRLSQLSAELGYPSSSTEMAQRLARLLSRDDEAVIVATLSGGRVVGWLHGSEQELLESGRRCEIVGLVVDPQHRGRGIGRQLIAAVEQWAMGRGLEQITVRSNILRPESHPFYERLGYLRTKTQHAYRKRLPATEQRSR